MLDEQPRFFFIHFSANDDAMKLARRIHAALDKAQSSRANGATETRQHCQPYREKENIVKRVSIKYRDRLQSFLRTALVVAATSATTMAAAEVSPEKPKTIVFVCLHGTVKSQMAAAHFNQIAKERGLPFTAISRGITPDGSIPPRIRDGLALDGLTPLNNAGVSLTVEEASGASKVVAFDDVPADRRGAADVTYWSDVPLDRKDYAATRDAIVRHLDALMPTLVTK